MLLCKRDQGYLNRVHLQLVAAQLEAILQLHGNHSFLQKNNPFCRRGEACIWRELIVWDRLGPSKCGRYPRRGGLLFPDSFLAILNLLDF